MRQIFTIWRMRSLSFRADGYMTAARFRANWHGRATTLRSDARGNMTRLILVIYCFLLVACTSPEEARHSAGEAYAAGDVQGAIHHLESLPADDYVAGNLRALYHISAAHHGGGNMEFERAVNSLREVKTPVKNSSEIGRYLTFLRFTALGNLGRVEEARQLYAAYCEASPNSPEFRNCLRLEWGRMSVLLEETRDDKLIEHLFASAKVAFLNVYGWDPQVFQNPADQRAFYEWLARARAEGRIKD